MPPPPLSPMVYTSGVFLINVFICYLYNYYVYSVLFLFLFITSILHHLESTNTTYIIDKIAIFSIVFYGGYIFYNKLMNSNYLMSLYPPMILYPPIIIGTFLCAGYLYYIGYINGKYCFDCDQATSCFYHGFMHLISSIGHICIVLMN